VSVIAAIIAILGELIALILKIFAFLLPLILKILAVILAISAIVLIGGVLLFRAKVLPGIRRFINRRSSQSGDSLIIDVIPNAPLQEHGFTPEEKAKIASEAVQEALANKNPDESPKDALTRLTHIAQETPGKREQPELVRIRRITLDLFSVFKNDPNRLRYTYERLSQSISGLNELANKSFATVTGMLYAAEDIRSYVTKLSAVATLLAVVKSETLSKNADEFIERMEKLQWLYLIFPAEKTKHGALTEDMLQSLTDKLQVYAKMNEYGVAGSGGEALIEKTETVVKEMNVALDTVLRNILERDLLKADTELDALRQDLRLRGLY
jgi:hypothetical protein